MSHDVCDKCGGNGVVYDFIKCAHCGQSYPPDKTDPHRTPAGEWCPSPSTPRTEGAPELGSQEDLFRQIERGNRMMAERDEARAEAEKLKGAGHVLYRQCLDANDWINLDGLFGKGDGPGHGLCICQSGDYPTAPPTEHSIVCTRFRADLATWTKTDKTNHGHGGSTNKKRKVGL